MYFTDCVVKAFPWDIFLNLCPCIKCKLRREDFLSFLVFFLTLRAQGMRKRWRRRQTRRFSPSPFFTLLLTSLLLRLGGEQDWEEEDARYFFSWDWSFFGLETCGITVCLNFFFYQGFLSETLTTHRTAGEGRGPFFIPLYHFHPLTNIQTFICNFACEMTITYF